jgi:hypothetical protein
MSLTTLPYDILFNVVRLLDVEELVNLGETSPVFKYICGEESLCRIAAEVRHSIRSLVSIPGLSSNLHYPEERPVRPRDRSRAR